MTHDVTSTFPNIGFPPHFLQPGVMMNTILWTGVSNHRHPPIWSAHMLWVRPPNQWPSVMVSLTDQCADLVCVFCVCTVQSVGQWSSPGRPHHSETQRGPPDHSGHPLQTQSGTGQKRKGVRIRLLPARETSMSYIWSFNAICWWNNTTVLYERPVVLCMCVCVRAGRYGLKCLSRYNS